MQSETGAVCVMAAHRDLEILFLELGHDLKPGYREELRDAIDTDDSHVAISPSVARRLVGLANEYDHEDRRLMLAVQLAGERLELRLDD